LNKEKENSNSESEENTPGDWKSVYIMESKNGEIKIGVSKNVKKRKKSIENSGMIRIVNIYKTKPCSNPFEIEKIMHEKFKKFRICGEWFSCSMGTAIPVLDKVFSEKAAFHIKKHEKNPLDYFAETVNKEIKGGKEYMENLEAFADFMVGISEKKNEQIERLISMVENLQAEIKAKNAELETMR